jgi:undecaprenyl-diphosphatase
MLNNNIFFFINNFSHQSAFVDWLIKFFATPFIFITILAAFIFLIFYTENHFDSKNLSWKYNLGPRLTKILFVSSSAVFAWAFTAVLKAIIAAPRPFLVFENLQPLFLHGGMDSFPSGHSTFLAALAVSLYLISKKVGIYFMIVAILVGLARVAAGIHFPIDILFGYIIGISSALIFSLIFKAKFINRLLAILTKTL